MTDRDNEQRTGRGEDVLRALVYGNDIAGLKMAGLDQARLLFGPDAVLEIDAVEDIHTAALVDRGLFHAVVIVRRADDGPDWIRPVADPEVPDA